MKRIHIFLLSLLVSMTVLPAQAHGVGHGGFGYRHGQHDGWRSNWVGPVLGAALVGSVIYSASTPSYVVAPPVLMAQPPIYSNRVAYFCSTAQQYYPNVQNCNVPWQLVSY